LTRIEKSNLEVVSKTLMKFDSKVRTNENGNRGINNMIIFDFSRNHPLFETIANQAK
jgi:hypothetical protein